MKYLVTIYNLKNVKQLLKSSTGLVVGLKGFSTRETSNLTINEFKELAKEVKSLNKELYISLKPLLFNDMIDGIKNLFHSLKDTIYTGVIVGDLGYYYLLKELNIGNIVYNPETLLTNIDDVNESFNIGLKGAFVSKEITINDIKKILKEKKGKIYLNAHGYLNMFYSKRSLIENYLNESKINYEFLNRQTLKIKERKRDGFYPIIEDDFGTHIFRKDVSTVLYDLKEFELADYLLIDSIFHDDEYTLKILNLFHEGIDQMLIDEIKTNYNETWDKGFLHTKTIYKRDEND